MNTEPTTAITDDMLAAEEQNRRRRLLYRLLQGTALVAAALLAGAWLLHSPDQIDQNEVLVRLGIVLSTVICGAGGIYLASRRISVDIASFTFLILITVAAAIVQNPQGIAGGRGPLIFVLPIIAASALLRPWASFVFAALSSLAIVFAGTALSAGSRGAPVIGEYFVVAMVAWLVARSVQHKNRALRLANEKLVAGEAGFKLLLASNPLPMWVYDLRTLQFLEVNEAAVEHYGYARDEFLCMRITDIRPAEDVERLLLDVRQERPVLQNSGEWRHRLHDGRIIDVTITSHLLDYAGQKSALVVAQDVTARRRVEEELRLLSRAVEQSPVSIVITDTAGAIEYVNSKFAQVTGYTMQEVLGNNPRLLKSGETPAEEYERLWRMITAGGEWRGEFHNRRKNGELFWEYASISPIRDAGGAIAHFLGVKEDITARKEAEAELRRLNEELERRVEERTMELQTVNASLERASRLKDEFLASMSHELRTPLTGILTVSEVLEENLYGPMNEKQTRAVGLIRESGEHLLGLINDILDVSKIEANLFKLEKAQVSVSQIGQASLRFVHEQATRKNLKVSFAFGQTDLLLEADSRRLKQILVNLLSNAVKFTPEGGSIGLEIAGDRETQAVYFSVWDTGPGIAPENLPRLFQPFTQLDTGLARQHEGTGLGLALVRQLAELHNGSVTVDSTAGIGSRFTVVLPWSNSRQQADGSDPKDAPQTTALSPLSTILGHAPVILLAEDNEINIATLGEYLAAEGCQMMVARDGNEALRLAEELLPDLILMDVQMPQVDGLTAIRQIRASGDARLAATPVIAVTALAMPGDRERCLGAGATDYMRKPFNCRTLTAAIRSYLEAKHHHV